MSFLNLERRYNIRLDDREGLTFYRVQYAGSRTKMYSNGLFAEDYNPPQYRSRGDFAYEIEESYNWDSDYESPFIKVFSEANHAERWAKCWTKRFGNEYEILEIDPMKMPDTLVFKLSELEGPLYLEIPPQSKSHIPNGYLCLNFIPKRAIRTYKTVNLSRDHADPGKHASHTSINMKDDQFEFYHDKRGNVFQVYPGLSDRGKPNRRPEVLYRLY